MKRVLVVDDEESIALLLTYQLEKEGFEVVEVGDGLEGYTLALEEAFDFIILDIMLPTMNGMDVCRKLRQEKVETPILMLTAKDDEIEKIISLELGADDYMTKPFSPREVLARIKAILRRTEGRVERAPNQSAEKETDAVENEKVLQVGTITICPDRYEVQVEGNSIDLTPKEFDLLLYMVERKNRTLSREQLLRAVWDFDYAGETRIVDVHIGHLREKIEKDTKNPEYLKTVRGFGYKLEDPS